VVRGIKIYRLAILGDEVRSDTPNIRRFRLACTVWGKKSTGPLVVNVTKHSRFERVGIVNADNLTEASVFGLVEFRNQPIYECLWILD
jgi:hypothetical protein